MYKFNLLRFLVKNFKSIEDSGWVNCNDVTTLVGVNEAGKSNLLIALWKLNPAKGGKIVLSDDMPISKFSELRLDPENHIFITAEFKITDEKILEEIVEVTDRSNAEVDIVQISKDYANNFHISFPKAEKNIKKEPSSLIAFLNTCKGEIDNKETSSEILVGIDEIIDLMSANPSVNLSIISEAEAILEKIILSEDSEESSSGFIGIIREEISRFKRALYLPSEYKFVREKIINNFPNFVYYSNYGNLDSEIYLPHVIENLERNDLTGVDEAKARTLKVLFEFVNLNPKEIYEMGTDAQGVKDYHGRVTRKPTDEEIKIKSEKKKERNILLQSASTKLTKDFRDWWKQGKYTFDLNADGKHFRILVSDDMRPERISLENRSTGLQWFLSFYLVFLVESTDSHSESIILLDEAGLSLHPLAQKDLSNFFLNLSTTNQIINTTHSPFLIDTNSIEKVKVVYIDSNGYTIVSDDLRASETQLKTNSVYAIHAALGLSISDTLLQGCKAVIVEGSSDQIYLNAIKLYLIHKKLISPLEEIVFVPSGGVRGVAPLSSLLSAKNELPVLVIDSDSAGLDYKNKLENSLYKSESDKKKIITVNSVLGLDNSEIEDIIPYEIMIEHLNRILDNYDLDFDRYHNSELPLINQYEEYAKDNNVKLKKGYKVDLARMVKGRMLGKDVSKKYEEIWVDIFNKIIEL